MIHHQCPHPYHQTKHRRRVEKSVLIAIVVGALVFFALGRYSVKSVDEYQAENGLLKESVAELMATNKELVKQQDFIENAEKIDAQAKKDARRSLTKLHDELSDVKEQLAFYQRVVAPETLIKGLYVNSFEIQALDEESTYEYQLVLAQGANQKRAIKGQYTLSIVGRFQGEDKTLSIKELNVEKEASYEFSFKYYELLTGKISFDDGFIPKQVNVTVKPSKKGSANLKQQWLWSKILVSD
jgi:hypothetical protein